MWGRFEHSMDDKARVIVPIRFREKLGEEFILTTGPGQQIRAYPIAAWEEYEEQLESRSVNDELNNDLIYLQRMFGSCEFVKPDREFRLTIARHLREWAGLREGETVIFIGNGSRVELWSRQNWETYMKDFTPERVGAARRALGMSDERSSLTPS